MLKSLAPTLLALALSLWLLTGPMPARGDELGEVGESEDKTLRDQRRESQKDRQSQRTARSEKLRDATRSFKEFVGDLNASYDTRIQDAEGDFQTRQVDLRAERDGRIAEAEANYQKRMTDLFASPGLAYDDETIEQLQSRWRQYSDELFQIKKDFGVAEHGEIMSRERLKNELLGERDREALEEAANLGLTSQVRPILAMPIGDALTESEKRWNEKERKDVARIEASNGALVHEFRVGDKLRKWEMANMQEDFELAWKEKQALQELAAEQQFFNAVLSQSAQGKKIDQQAISARFTELNKQSKLIKIEYDSMRKKSSIRRRDQKKEMLGR